MHDSVLSRSGEIFKYIFQYVICVIDVKIFPKTMWMIKLFLIKNFMNYDITQGEQEFYKSWTMKITIGIDIIQGQQQESKNLYIFLPIIHAYLYPCEIVSNRTIIKLFIIIHNYSKLFIIIRMKVKHSYMVILYPVSS